MIDTACFTRDRVMGVFHSSLKDVGLTLPFPPQIRVKSNISQKIMIYIVDTVWTMKNKDTKLQRYVAALPTKTGCIYLYST